MADDVMARDDEAEEETLKDFVVEQVDKFFIDHIPIEFIKDLDSTCKFTNLASPFSFF